MGAGQLGTEWPRTTASAGRERGTAAHPHTSTALSQVVHLLVSLTVNQRHSPLRCSRHTPHAHPEVPKERHGGESSTCSRKQDTRSLLHRTCTLGGPPIQGVTKESGQ